MNLGEARAKMGWELAPVIPIDSARQSPIYNEGTPRQVPPGSTLGKATAGAGQVHMPAGQWAGYAGRLGAAITVTTSGAIIRRQGYEPEEPDESDVTLLREALEEGLKLRFGDGPVPWWLGAALAAGSVYAGMRIGAKKIKKDPMAAETQAPVEPATTNPPEVRTSESRYRSIALPQVKSVGGG